MSKNTTTTRSTPNNKSRDNERDAVTTRFIVTGFGPFQDVLINPTTCLVENLVPYLRTLEDKEVLGDKDESIKTCCAGVGEYSSLSLSSLVNRTLVIETAAEAARQQIAELYDELTTSIPTRTSGGADATNTVVIILHLGVNHKGTTFQLESCAYNEAIFRVPDERGYQPQQDIILKDQELAAPLFTDFDVAALVDHLNESYVRELKDGEEREDMIVVKSTDPGRFVCNFTYCLSLDQCQKRNSSKNSYCDENEPIPNKFWCLFLHVPPFHIIPEQEQLEFLGRLMKQLTAQARHQSTG